MSVPPMTFVRCFDRATVQEIIDTAIEIADATEYSDDRWHLVFAKAAELLAHGAMVQAPQVSVNLPLGKLGHRGSTR